MNIHDSFKILQESIEPDEYVNHKKLASMLGNNQFQSVLGIDILDYSQLSNTEQYFVPILFHSLIKSTIADIFKYEKFIFQYTNSDLIFEKFIDSGDGGFFIFDTPLHSVLFALYFECNLRHYNNGTYNKNIYSLLKTIKVRYAITYDIVYYMKDLKNHYGAGLINCARIMAKDKLDRCIIDENTHTWFLKRTNGIESLRNYHIRKIMKIKEFSHYTYDEQEYKFSGYSSYAIPEEKSQFEPGIDLILIMKIGTIKLKKLEISVYNLLIQLPTKIDNVYKKLDFDNDIFMVVTLGNNNTVGLDQQY